MGKLENKNNSRAPHVETRSEKSGRVKYVIRKILKSEDTKKSTNNAIQLAPVPENNNSYYKQTVGMKLDSTRKHILIEINNMGFKKICITNVGTYNLSKIDTPIRETEKFSGLGKTLRNCLL